MEVNFRAPTICGWDPCSNLLRPRPIGQRGRFRLYCSDPCLRSGSGWHESMNPRRCSLDGCNRPHRAGGLCTAHWKAKDRALNGRNEPWNDTARDAYHRRRALITATQTVPVLRDEIAERDGYVCQLCYKSVDMSLPYPKWGSPSLDHSIPLTRGGTHHPANVTLSHLGCNLDKRNMTRAEWFALRASA